MVDRAVVIVTVRVHARRESASDRVHLNLDAHLEGGYNSFVAAAWRDADDKWLKDEKRSRVSRPEDTLTYQDVALIRAKVGFYGESGEIFNVETDEVELEHDGQMANTALLRVGVMQANPETGLLFVEQSRGGNLRNSLEGAVRAHLKVLAPNLTVEFTAVMAEDSWLENVAELQKVQVVRISPAMDIADENTRVPTVFEHSVKPKGAKGFGSRLLHKFLRGDADPRDLFELPPSEETDEEFVKLQVGDGTRSRTFVIDDPKTPPIRELLPEGSAGGILSDKEFAGWCEEKAKAMASQFEV